MDWEKVGRKMNDMQSKMNSENERASTPDVSVKKSPLLRIFKIAVIVGMICFIFPFCTVSCSGQEVGTLSGMDLLSGFTYGEEEFDPNVFIAGSLICALWALVFAGIRSDVQSLIWKKRKQTEKPKLHRARLFSFAAAAFLILFRVTIPMQLEHYGYSLSYFDIIIHFRVGWYLSVIAFLCGFFCEYLLPKATQLSDNAPDIEKQAQSGPASEEEKAESEAQDNAAEMDAVAQTAESNESTIIAPESAACSEAPRFCTSCGSPVSGNFCTNCGKKISRE